ncbi:acylglycerol kinase, mitochondrial-like [Centruroides sculpturatus]|uniref:acylglycerol kinase, mitochondrial-like n=1 Tax=Centruroides sculpturatus TaxID=218467 RepID=UPI000C6E978F|nr:acylglycerol kinase, mitochondrial-like [Centruroides sculpturatus]
MAKLMNILKTLRNHWKKSIFACGLMTYGSFYLRDRYRIEKMMRAYCEEAKNYGDMPLPVNGKPRHITVILNPVAKNGAALYVYGEFAYLQPLSLFVTYTEPIYGVTEKEGQAKDLMEVMDNTDSVIVAGGNGTLHEAVTGLLRRSDAQLRCSGVVHFTDVQNIYPELECIHYTYTTLIVELCISPAKDYTNVINEECGTWHSEQVPSPGILIETKNLETTNNCLYCRYWLFGPLKTKIAYISRAFQEWPSNQEFDLSYIYPCGGCSKCYEKPIEIKSRRWWEAFIPKTPNISGISPAKDYTNVINEECGTWHSEQVPSPGILIETKNLETTNEEHFLNVVIHSSNLSRLQFINEGITRGKQKMEEETEFKKVIKVRELKLMLDVEEGKEQWCNIDTDNYEVQPVHIQLLPQKVYIYSNG